MESIKALLAEPVGQAGQTVITLGHIALAALVLVVAAVFAAWRRSARQAGVRAAAEAERDRREADQQRLLADLMKAQGEMQGRMATLADVFGSRQAELNQSIRERLDGMTSRIGQTMSEQTRATHENLAKLQERLAVIDTAQTNIQSLAGQVVELQAILSNKQTRGAFGQGRMEAIIADALPAGAYEFQATLPNGSRPDCLILMPNGAPPLAIDAKFPLEGWNAVRDAETPDAERQARQRFRRDMEVHVTAIAEKYLLPGETQDTAFLFVPSESIFADIHEHFEALVQKAHRARVVIVSPSLLMLSVQVVQAVLKDARMREQAHLIQGEVAHLMADLGRLNDRVMKLQNHFGQASRDIEQIVTSTQKLARRGETIEGLEFGQPSEPAEARRTPAMPSAEGQASTEPPQGRLRLRVVDED
ncbi:DNA recombination protein RmuC [Zhengella mangrovi]|uniref:DNA recombination protein RmuC homolog n=1 Tax=Zhengella mangrovi TaxID=1982044 RepID=A0A2G1QU69_9HYPH|nr:DNA recombination protein RmuC [Zhengella mangrovi]PHP69106.1 DNA recombination protein RmuC [Zhengella mangrovi]